MEKREEYISKSHAMERFRQRLNRVERGSLEEAYYTACLDILDTERGLYIPENDAVRKVPSFWSAVAIGDMVTRCMLFACITYAAVYFGNWKIMLLCLFGLLFNHNYESKTVREDSAHKN